ncbi:MarR family winged helix-turn-helix transcriptional regulator [Fodinibius salsisoli]|uniref:MarR family transcriptional regulator n=1 Tax=Fodinibius salsisoli TaxID=2820877 RepID=A0ABT3PML5_9BACT|nr:MarR family transcriptional regulator [Fodinibius salsisoli]MCW9707196.1 MarR family transcriptional regulator [Fodinibius salsisoli]
MDEQLDAVGVTTPQYAALSILEEDQGLSNAELARRCFLTPQTMHKIIGGLEAKRLVERKADPSHGRKINTLLTSEGKKLLKKAHKIVQNIEGEMTSDLTEEEIEETRKNLAQCIESLEDS